MKKRLLLLLVYILLTPLYILATFVCAIMIPYSLFSFVVSGSDMSCDLFLPVHLVIKLQFKLEDYAERN